MFYKRLIKDFLRWKSYHPIFGWSSYARWVYDVKFNKNFFVPFTNHPFVREDNDPKLFAYYLPQFHAIPENDAVHGVGFTEWQNTASCPALFIGHYQPKIPYDIGFYNLMMPGVMERQAEVAKSYGIYGFCFYYYWFSGKKVLDKPLQYWLEHKEIDFHYHFCWANENWSKLWDGGDKEVFLKQDIREDDADVFFYDILPYIRDERYEKIGNKPLLIIYRPALFKKDVFVRFINRINYLACTCGFNGFYITSSNFDKISPLELGLDGITEFPPHGMLGQCREMFFKRKYVPKTTFSILSVHQYIRNEDYLTKSSFALFKACFPCWDNTPRKAWSNGYVFLLSDQDFVSWLEGLILWTRKNNPIDKQYIYINAWNEWGEGAILEPTLRFGYKYLQLVRDALEKMRNEHKKASCISNHT